jgi:hypothetical protein
MEELQLKSTANLLSDDNKRLWQVVRDFVNTSHTAYPSSLYRHGITNILSGDDDRPWHVVRNFMRASNTTELSSLFGHDA